MKELTPEQAWEQIAQMGWSTITTDYQEIAKRFFKQFGKAGMKRLHSFVGDRVSDLGKAVDRHEKNIGPLEVGSDDSFSDLRYHVVGLGRYEFNLCMDNPEELQKRYHKGQYKESFCYCFMEPDPPRTEEQKRETLEKLMAKIAEVEKQACTLDAGLTLLRDKMHTLSLLAATVKQDIEEKDKETA